MAEYHERHLTALILTHQYHHISEPDMIESRKDNFREKETTWAASGVYFSREEEKFPIV